MQHSFSTIFCTFFSLLPAVSASCNETSAVTFSTVTSSGFRPSGFTPSGVTPSGVTPSGFTPSGVTPSGVTPSGVIPSGIVSSGVPSGVPSNVQNFYNRIKGQGSCPKKLQGGFYSEEGDDKNSAYCQDQATGVLYIQGEGGNLSNMDIDCDGKQGGVGDDGRCGKSTDTQSITAFQDTVAGYKAGITDLNAYVHPYVVFGNDDSDPSFSPEKYGVKPLSVMAVVYGIWGDTNGNDGPPLVGEASISLATACYGKDKINGNEGHDGMDVLYIAFPGADALPGASGAKWDATSYSEFESSIAAIGNNLTAHLS